ncbi:MAG TPA: hypothetical protein PK765_03755 [bacterium]|nr:hypothetical protein [bacterium]
MRDIWHFLGWFALFFSLLSLRSIAVAPEGETSYDSSSIYNQEESLIVSTDALSDSGSTL